MCTYHINVFMLSIKVLHFTETDFKRILGYILCPDQRGIILFTSPKVLRRHKSNRMFLESVLQLRNI